MEEKCKELEDEVITLNRSVEELKGEIIDLRNQLQLAKEKIYSYSQQIESLEKASTQQHDDIAMKSNALAKADKMIYEMTQQLESEQLEQRLLQARIVALTMERDNHAYQLKKAVERSSQNETALRDSFNKEMKEIQRINNERDQTVMDDCEWKLREIEKKYKQHLERERLSQEENFKAELEKLKGKHECEQHQLQNENASLIKQQKCLENQLSSQKLSAEAEFNKLQGLIQDLQRDKHTAESQINQMMENERKLVENLNDINYEIAESHKLISKLKSEICDIKSHHEKVLVRLEIQALRKIDEVKTTMEERCTEKLRQQASNLQEKLQKIYEDEKQFALEMLQSKRNTELNELVKEFEYKEDDYHLQLEYLKTISNGLRDENVALQETLYKSQNENSVLNKKLKLIEEQLEQEYFKLRLNFTDALPFEHSSLTVETLKATNYGDLQKQLMDFTEQRMAFDLKCKEKIINIVKNYDVEKVEVLQELIDIFQIILKTLQFEAEKNLHFAQQKENELNQNLVELQEKLKLVESQICFNQNVMISEGVFKLIDMIPPPKRCVWMYWIILMSTIALGCCIFVACSMTLLLIMFLLPALLTYVTL